MDEASKELLALVSTEDLAAEMLSRCDHGAIVLMRLPSAKVAGAPETMEMTRFFAGHSLMVVGMLDVAKKACLAGYEESRIS